MFIIKKYDTINLILGFFMVEDSSENIILNIIINNEYIHYKKDISKFLFDSLLRLKNNQLNLTCINSLKKELNKTQENPDGNKFLLFSYDSTIKTSQNYKNLLNNYVLIVSNKSYIFIFDLLFHKYHVFDNYFKHIYSFNSSFDPFNLENSLSNKFINLYSNKFVISENFLKLSPYPKISFIPCLAEEKKFFINFNSEILKLYMKIDDKSKNNQISNIYTSDSEIIISFKRAIYHYIVFDNNFNIQYFVLNNAFYNKIKKLYSFNNKIIKASSFEELYHKIKNSLDLYELQNDNNLISINNKEFNDKINIVKNLYNNKKKYCNILNKLKVLVYKQNNFFTLMFSEKEYSNSENYDSYNIEQLFSLKFILKSFNNNHFIIKNKEDIIKIQKIKGIL